MTATELTAALPSQPAARSTHRLPLSVSVVWVVVGVAWVAALVITGSPLADVARWVATVLIGVIVPGIAIVRAVRPATVPLVEDLAWAAVTGCVVAMAGWVLDVTLPWAMPPWLWGPLVAAVTLVAPRTRARVLARPAPGWGLRPHLALGGCMLVAIGWMTSDYLRFNPLDPGPGGHTYYPDTLLQLALVGELRHSLIPHYPMVHGDPFAYHWFLHAVLAHLLTGTGVNPFDVVLRLIATTLVPAVLLITAAVARRTADRIWAGPIAAALFAVVGATVATVWTTDGQTQQIVGTYWAASLTTAFGWLATVAVAGCVIAVLRRDPMDAAIPHRLLIPLTILAAGAKSADLAVLVVGTASALLVTLLRRRRVAPALITTATVGITLLVARYTIYGGTDYGLRLDPFAGILTRAAGLFPGLTHTPPGTTTLSSPTVPELVTIAVFALWLLPLLPRLAGLVPLLRRRVHDPVTWFILGTTAAGFGATLAYRHPASSEILFLSAAYPVGLIGSAWGLTLLPRPTKARTTTTIAIGAAIGLVLTIGTAALAGANPRITTWTATHGHPPTATDVGEFRQILWWTAPLALVAVALIILSGLAWPVTHRTARQMIVIGAVSALLGTGLLSTGLYLTSGATSPSYNQVQATTTDNLPVTRDDVTASHWLDANSAPTDVIAVNRTCLQPVGTTPCTAKDYTISALSERDTDVGGWAYAPRNLDSGWTTTDWYANQPFWDPARLNQEITAFTHPTPTILNTLYAQGIRWLIADHGGQPPNTPLLDHLTTRRLTLPTLAIWQLHSPE